MVAGASAPGTAATDTSAATVAATSISTPAPTSVFKKLLNNKISRHTNIEELIEPADAGSFLGSALKAALSATAEEDSAASSQVVIAAVNLALSLSYTLGVAVAAPSLKAAMGAPDLDATWQMKG
ncbi:hypothetical protein PRNP1_015437 [Phytophthora ramorum]